MKGVNMGKDKIFLILMLSLIFMCYLGAVSANEISEDTLSVDTNVDSISESSDEVLEVNDNENEVLSSNPTTASTWSQLYTACNASSDQEITLSDNIVIGEDDISFKNNAVIKGNSNYYITGNAAGRIPFQCGNLALDITFEDVIFKGISSTMLIKMQNSGVTTLKGCKFINVNASSSGQNSVVYNNNGIMNIENCTFSNCNAAFGPITNHKAGSTTGVTLNIYNSTFNNNYGNAPGVINNCGVMTVYNSVFNNNRANQWGGAIHTHSGATSTIRKSAFNGNLAGWNGGALYAYGTVIVYDSNFTNNNCTTNNGGGAIGASNYFFTKYNIYVNNCRFVDNNNLCYLFDENSTETLGRGGAISVMNGGWLTVLGSTFIHNGAQIGQAICGYNTNYYSNISSGEYVLKINNNEFINHTITTNDTVYYVGGCTFTGNSFTNSPQTIGTTGNVIQSFNDGNGDILSVNNDILGISEADVLSDNPIDLYVNASSNKQAFNMVPGMMISDDANARSWETAPGIGFDGPDDLFENLIQNYDMEGYDVFNINVADGIYSGIKGLPNDVNYIGYGDNVIFKLNDLSYESMLSNHKITFTNIIFLDEPITCDDFNFEFTNCTFKNCNIEFAKVKSSKTYSEETNVKICIASLINCKFIDSSADSIINVHKYEIVNIDNCTFDNVTSDAIVLVTSNYTDVNDVKDGVTINKLNLINSTVKGIIKVEKDSLSRLSNDNVNHDFETVQDNLVDGDYTYLIVPVTKTNLTVKVADIKEGEAFTIDVALSNNLTANVSVVINKKEYNISVVNGTGSLKVSDKLVANTYDVEASYAGEYPYAASAATTTFKVEKVSTPESDKDKQIPKVTKKATKITAKKKTFKAKKKTKKYTIVLKAGKAAVKKVKLTLKVGKKTYKATTNSKGKATFKLTKLTKKGKYTAVVKFKGNKYYKATSKKVKITVK